jgi:hypothetical protein
VIQEWNSHKRTCVDAFNQRCGPTRLLSLAMKVVHPLSWRTGPTTFNHIQSVVSESHLLKLNLSAAFCPIVPRWQSQRHPHQAGITEQKLFAFTSLESLYPFDPDRFGCGPIVLLG